MNKEDLSKRIEVIKSKIEKTEKLKDKYYNKIDEENKKYLDFSYTWIDINHLNLPFEQQSAIENCRDKIREIQGLQTTLDKYNKKLSEISSFKQEDRIKVIWDFLLKWKEDTINFIKENAELLYSLRNNYRKAFEDYKSKHPEEFNGDNWRAEYYKEKDFQKTYYAPIHNLTYNVYTRGGKVDEKRLNDILDNDIELKYKSLEAKIKNVCGEIVDASDLYIANNGMINGYIVGTEGKAYVETIVAGGYNQNTIVNTKHGQIVHYRVLVKKLN